MPASCRVRGSPCTPFSCAGGGSLDTTVNFVNLVAGALLGTVAAGRLSRRFGMGRTIIAGAVLFSAPVAALPLAGGPCGRASRSSPSTSAAAPAETG
ncbi:hypothetical protein ACFUC1_10215 [Pedococcus sp. NPDC057267]|uniref:hypothetical protein n=1 Tax=Pedococcus sp. NPDC057267 TaxID=3346077 RepID=UPI00363B1193